jgi:hypothetical protein
MSGFQSKKMLSASRDSKLPIEEYANALFEATVALDERNSLKPTPQQNLIWLQALSEMWVRQSRNEVSTC